MLPDDARKWLQDAAKTKNTTDDPNAREKAIDKATLRAKRKYPHLFRD